MTRASHLDHLDARTDHLDGWSADLAGCDDGSIEVTVSGAGRNWRAHRPTIDAAIEVAGRIVATHASPDSLWIDPELPCPT